MHGVWVVSGSKRPSERVATSPYLRRRRRTVEEAEADRHRRDRERGVEVVPRAERTDNRSFGDEA